MLRSYQGFQLLKPDLHLVLGLRSVPEKASGSAELASMLCTC